LKPANWPANVPYIDPNVRHVGVTLLRQMNALDLTNLGDTVYVLQVGEQPVAVLCAYETFMRRCSSEDKPRPADEGLNINPEKPA
jgi:hypothetical protein